MKQAKWHFATAKPNMPQQNPQLGDLFDRNSKDSLVSALIRESVQNALDATINKNDCARISVTFGKIDKEKFARQQSGPLANYRNHFKQAFPKRIFPEEELSFVAIEDENTAGLTGSIHTHFEPDDREQRKKERLYFFWKTDGGITNKDEQSGLGTRGIGKAIFNFSTELRMFWATSHRACENDSIFIGRSILKQHKIDGKTYLFRGLYGVGHSTEDGDDCTLPCQDSAAIKSFHKDFGLKRKFDSDGTSIVIPFIESLKDVSREMLMERIIEEFGIAIIRDKLSFSVDHYGTKNDLTKDNIQDQVDLLNKPELSQLIKLYRQIEQDKTSATELPVVTSKTPKDYNKSLTDFDGLPQLQNDYAEGKLLLLKVPFSRKITKLQEDCHWLISLQLVDTSKDVSALNKFNRGGLDITHEPAVKIKDAHAFVFPDDSKLTEILSRSENAAHTKFEVGIENFSEYKTSYRWVITQARHIAMIIHKSLAPPSSNLDDKMLANFFPFDEKDGKAPIPKPTPEPSLSPSPVPDFDSSEQQLAIRKIVAKGNSGIRITGGAKTLIKGDKVQCEFAYHMRGRSFGKYNEYDFSLKNNTRNIPRISIANSGTKIPEVVGGNELTFVINDPEKWNVTLLGFNPIFDLDVRANIITKEE